LTRGATRCSVSLGMSNDEIAARLIIAPAP
jgi:hypothetical protein